LEEINTFLNITGPWGVVGILLAFAYYWLKRDDKSVRESLDAQIKALEALCKALDKMEISLSNHDERAREIHSLQERDHEMLSALAAAIAQRGSAKIVVDSTNKGSAE